MNLEFEELELEVEDSESQLNQEIFDSEEDSVDVLTQTLWNQVEDSDKFASQILEALRKKVRYHSKIFLAECENLDNFLYFRNRKYISNFNHLRLWIIQLAHDSVADEHSERAKCYDLVSHVYWWLNIYKYVQRFVWNCHVCIRFKPFRQRTQEWLRSLSVFQRRWRDVSMNYVDSLSLSIFMNIIYRYVLVFVDRLIKDETSSLHCDHESERSHKCILRSCLKTSRITRVLSVRSRHSVHLQCLKSLMSDA